MLTAWVTCIPPELMTPKTDPLMIPTMRAWWSNHEDVRRWAGDVPSFPESPLNRIDDTLDEQLEQKWNVWKRTETHDEAFLCGETEAAIQQWKNVSDKSVGKVFKALPTRADLVLSNA